MKIYIDMGFPLWVLLTYLVCIYPPPDFSFISYMTGSFIMILTITIGKVTAG